MKIKLSHSSILSLVLAYPVLLGFVYFINISPFFITAPYFFLLNLIFFTKVLQKKVFTIPYSKRTDVILCLVLLGWSILNFSSLRYSLPILFTFYALTLQLYIIFIRKDSDFKLFKLNKSYLIIYIFLSLFFYLFLDFSFTSVGDRFNGFTGSPTTYAAIMTLIYLLVDNQIKMAFYKKLIFFLVIFTFVYLSKTRLVLFFLALYPILSYIINKKTLGYPFVFLSVFSVLFFVYPIYSLIVDYFPGIVSIRYESGRDSSFGLRHYLYLLVKEDFFNGSIWEMLFGKGNEYSRRLVLDELSVDLFPHNDFMRLIIDWGIVGSVAFFYYLYRLSVNDFTSLMISILYMILFYSNMIFNLFIISVLILYSLKISPRKLIQ